jgi:uncharacterized CHY-type Zn-finger protein
MTIRTRPATNEYRENFDRIFRQTTSDGCVVCRDRNKPTTVSGERMEECPACGRRFNEETKP